MSFHEMILFNGRRWPNKPAIVMLDHFVTYGMILDGVGAVATELRRQGLGRGMMVGIQVATPSWHMIVICALAEIGAASISLQVKEPLDSAGVPLDAVIAQAPHKIRPAERVLYMHESWFGTPVVPATERGFAAPTDIVRIGLSSGTTGRQKAIGYTAHDVIERRNINALLVQSVPWERMLLLLGLGVNFGFQMALLSLSLGRTLSFAGTAEDAVKVATLFQADFVMGSNANIAGYVDQIERARANPPQLKFCYVGGSMVTKTFSDRISRILRCDVMFGYGSAESGPVALTITNTGNIVDGVGGFVAPWAQIEVIDDAGQPLPQGAEGRIRVRSSNNGRPFLTRTTTGDDFSGGWHYPGDVGRFDAAGMLLITGRSDDLLNSGGSKISPDLVDDALRAAPGIGEVAVTSVIGTSGVSEIWAGVAGDAAFDETALLAWARAHVPQSPIRRFVRVASIPRTPSGKVMRDALRELLEASMPRH